MTDDRIETFKITDETVSFIYTHLEDDVRTLALRTAPDNVDLPFALRQIQGLQTAHHKLPLWAATAHIVYPSHLSLEQCSGQFTASYKHKLLVRVLSQFSTISSEYIENPISYTQLCHTESVQVPHTQVGSEFFKAAPFFPNFTLVDLTGGMGVDFSFMAPLFADAMYVERQEPLCIMARHNFRMLGLQRFSVVCADAVQHLAVMPAATVIYLDPARRNANGGRTYDISDCSPDVLAMLSVLVGKTDILLLKLSPMLDISATISKLNRAATDDFRVAEIHIVAVRNECKELLVVMRRCQSAVRITCVNDDDVFVYSPDEPHTVVVPPISVQINAGMYLYEPNAALMKAGCFNALAATYGVRAIAANSHLFVSDQWIKDFPGRKFQIDAVSGMGRREVRVLLQGVDSANIAVRNHPLTAEALRRKLGLRDGGDVYLFATRNADGMGVLLKCSKPAAASYV